MTGQPQTRSREGPGGTERRKQIQAETARLQALFPGMGVQKAILFGSAARGEVLEGSDIDLILVRDTAERYLDRVGEALDALRSRVDLDLLVYTPREFERLRWPHSSPARGSTTMPASTPSRWSRKP